MYAKNVSLDLFMKHGAFGGLRSSMDLLRSFGSLLLAGSSVRPSLLAPVL